MGFLNEHLNDIIAYLLLGSVGAFIGVAGLIALRHRIRIVLSTRRHRKSAARYKDRTTMQVLPAAPPVERAPDPGPLAEPLSQSVLSLFSDFDRRYARIRAEIDSFDATQTG
jgi:hypothetical protein